jgi:hypothetical protein
MPRITGTRMVLYQVFGVGPGFWPVTRANCRACISIATYFGLLANCSLKI